MKVEGIALREFPFAEGPEGTAIRRVNVGETVTANLTTMRAWAAVGKVKFDDPKTAASDQDDSQA
jgi:hypothetical protein